jgi:hypothetical protein
MLCDRAVTPAFDAAPEGQRHWRRVVPGCLNDFHNLLRKRTDE